MAKPPRFILGSPEIEGEIVFCDADNINNDRIYPGKYTYQDNVSVHNKAKVCMEDYDPNFSSLVKEGDVLVSGFNFGCGGSREQAVTATLAKKIPLVIAGSLATFFSRNSVNYALMTLEVPKLVQRLRETYSASGRPARPEEIREPKENRQSLDSPPPVPSPSQEKVLSRRKSWKLLWDVKRSQVEVQEGMNGRKWVEALGELLTCECARDYCQGWSGEVG